MSRPVVLITGALTGIGRATALAFARDGARVVVSGRREVEGKALEAELRGLGAGGVIRLESPRADAAARVFAQPFLAGKRRPFVTRPLSPGGL